MLGSTVRVLVLNRRRAGTTIVLLPLFLLLRFRFPADAPSESLWNGELVVPATAATAFNVFFFTGVA